MIELRSDTFTQPTRAMREAMATAAVGDDVYREDPTVRRLEELAADQIGKPAACLMPSGTMANLAVILAQTPRGGKLIVGAESDIYLYEAGGAAVCGGAVYAPVPNNPDGTLSLTDLAAEFPTEPDDPQFALPRLICLENTQNRCGGAVLPVGYLRAVSDFARDRGVAFHLDGARIFNAAVAAGVDAAELARPADSVQFCLSKGLSAPIGSIVAGDAALVGRVRAVRKMLGGGMRQAGIVAAAGIVALDQMVGRLAEDHCQARRLADGLTGIPGIVLAQLTVVTNIVLFRVIDERWTVPAFVAECDRRGLAIAEFGADRLRAVTHRGVSARDIDRALEIVSDTISYA
jgi:threonine aldolase